VTPAIDGEPRHENVGQTPNELLSRRPAPGTGQTHPHYDQWQGTHFSRPQSPPTVVSDPKVNDEELEKQMIKKRFGGLVAAAATSVLVMATSASLSSGASAAPDSANGSRSPAVLVGGRCTGSWVDIKDTVEAQARPQAGSGYVFTLYAGETVPCRKIVVGVDYKACGVNDANGWILVQDDLRRHDGTPGWSGYIPSVCTSDR
jgi:hypothetical protein